MRNILLITYLIICSSFALADKTALEKEVQEAESRGYELFNLIKNSKPIKIDELNISKKDKRSLKKKQCKGYKYNYYLKKTDNKRVTAYGIAQPKKDGVVIGRHIAFEINNSSLKNISTSTKSCLEIHGSPEYKNILWATHLLSDAPNLFHVYQSLNYKTSIYIGTNVQHWKVDNGKISVLK